MYLVIRRRRQMIVILRGWAQIQLLIVVNSLFTRSAETVPVFDVSFLATEELPGRVLCCIYLLERRGRAARNFFPKKDHCFSGRPANIELV